MSLPGLVRVMNGGGRFGRSRGGPLGSRNPFQKGFLGWAVVWGIPESRNPTLPHQVRLKPPQPFWISEHRWRPEMGSGPVRGLRGVVLEGCSKGARSSVLFSVAPPDFNRLRRTVLETLLFGKRAGARNVLPVWARPGVWARCSKVLEGARRCSKYFAVFRV